MAEARSLPAIPAVMKSVTEVIAAALDRAEHGPDLQPLTRLISTDEAVAARVLSAANGTEGGRVCDIAAAVERLGFERLCCEVLSIKTLTPQEAAGWDYEAFWKNSLARAIAAAEMAASAEDDMSEAHAYSCGLLSDIGMRAMACLMPKAFRRAIQAAGSRNINICEVERDVLGMDHTIAGRRLAELWHLPEVIRDVIWLHHQPVEAIPKNLPHRKLIALVGLADDMANRKFPAHAGAHLRTAEQQAFAEYLNISESVIEDIRSALPAKLKDKIGDIEFVDDDGDRLADIQARSNECLARINRSLLGRNRSLSMRVESLGRAKELVGRAAAENTLTQILASIVHAFADACDGQGGGVSAYAIMSDAGRVVMARTEASGGISYRTVEIKKDAPLPETNAATEAALGEILENAGECYQWLGIAGCRHAALCCGNEWVGGVLHRPGGKLTVASLSELVDTAGVLLALALRYEKMAATGESLSTATQVLAAKEEAVSAQKTLKAIGHLAAGAGHELNNPLAVVMGRAQMLADRARTKKDRTAAEQIIKRAGQVSGIISAMMDFASPPPPKIAAVRPGELLTEALEKFRFSEIPQAASLNADIEIGDNLPPVAADRSQMLTVLNELLSNAATAGKDTEGFRVRLTAEFDEVSGAVLLAVHDNGPGMEQEMTEDVFIPFLSISRAGRRRGMGLAMAKRYVANCGGEIWITAAPNEGTSVYMRLERWTQE